MGFFVKTLPEIVSGFQKTIDDLDRLHKSHSEVIGWNDVERERLAQESALLHVERNTAKAIKDKIAALIAA